ncbi:MAG: flagellar export protein FliJ [endosymbiont of Galathealinum brachiosum]|uniref:Flagellar FliJ protein n=1 Tax=endosymbiont of Galathealinum brachiosum TaxID=2200906 RepID=A0A370DJD7_9GAMM|nr:MAG: flagellar export protein FliJ [endosymbiont of Galathealinum brachiosum]
MRSKRIQPIAKHAEQLQQQAVQIFVAAQQAVVDAQLQLEQLIGYRSEYNSNRVSSGLGAMQLKDYQLFLNKLNQSIEQARTNIQNKKQVCEQQKLNWLKTRSRSKALDAVIVKYQMQEAQIEARIEQKEQDEFSSRIKR